MIQLRNGLETFWQSVDDKAKTKNRFAEILAELASDSKNWPELDLYICSRMAKFSSVLKFYSSKIS